MTALAVVLTLVAGLAGAVEVAVMGRFGDRIGTSPALAFAFATIGVFIAAQLAMGVVIDRFGLFGLDRIPLAGTRIAGLALLAVGAGLTLHPS